MIAATSIRTRYTAAEAVRAILQNDRESDMEDSETKEPENDHILEPSDPIELAWPTAQIQSVRYSGGSRGMGRDRGNRDEGGQQLPEEKETEAIGTRVDSNCQKKRELTLHYIVRELCRCHICGCIHHLDDKVFK